MDDPIEVGMEMAHASVGGVMGYFDFHGYAVAGALVFVVTGPSAFGAVAYHQDAYPTDAEFLDRVEAWIAERRADIAGAKGRLN